MAYRDVKYYNLLSAKAATGESEQIVCTDFRNAIIDLGTASSGNLTVKVKGGNFMKNSDGTLTAPDLSAARSVTNIWDYVQIVDLEDGNAIDGDTGVSWAGTDDYRKFEVNINNLDFVSVEVSAYSAGSVTGYLTLSDNQ